jgi:hypothetical protein
MLDALIMTGAAYGAYKLAKEAFRTSDPTEAQVNQASRRLDDWKQKQPVKGTTGPQKAVANKPPIPGVKLDFFEQQKAVRQQPGNPFSAIEYLEKEIGVKKGTTIITKNGQVQYGNNKFSLSEIQQIRNTPGWENLTPDQRVRFLGSEYAKFDRKVTKIKKPGELPKHKRGGMKTSYGGGGMGGFPGTGPLRDIGKKQGN